MEKTEFHYDEEINNVAFEIFGNNHYNECAYFITANDYANGHVFDFFVTEYDVKGDFNDENSVKDAIRELIKEHMNDDLLYANNDVVKKNIDGFMGDLDTLKKTIENSPDPKIALRHIIEFIDNKITYLTDSQIFSNINEMDLTDRMQLETEFNTNLTKKFML